MKADVAIIGGGVIGTAIAWKLAHFKLDVILIESNPDIAAATTKANGGVIHVGYDPKPGTVMAKMCVEGAKSYPKLAKQLGFSLRRTGGLLVGTKNEDESIIQKKMEYGAENGVEDLHILHGLEEIQNIEPRVTKEARTALYIPRTAVVDPFEVAIAFAENAEVNGVRFARNRRISRIKEDENGFSLIAENGGTVQASYVVNAAGVYADEVAGMIADFSFQVDARLGEVLVLDKEERGGVNTVLFPMPSEVSKGIIVIPTASGNTLVSATARMTNNKGGYATTKEGIEELFSQGCRLVPDLNRGLLIRQFTGLRSVLRGTDDFLIEPSEKNPHFIHVAGIKSPGLASAPAIAGLVVELLEREGLNIEEKQDHVDERKKAVPFSKLTDGEKQRWIQKNPDYGKVVCRCETITRGEIIDAIHAPVGARTVDGVKRRTRAGMGRCQGGFCQPRVLEILAEELGAEPWEICKEMENSPIVLDKMKGGPAR